MILDFKADRWHALRHDVICARTGEPIDLPIFYANDVEGIVRYYLQTDDGNYIPSSTGAAWREIRKACKIVRKPPSQVAQIDEYERNIAAESKRLDTLWATSESEEFSEAPR